MHALAATEKGKHNGHSVQAYAVLVHREQSKVNWEVQAARVAKKANIPNLADLWKRTQHLVEIHAAPEHCWTAPVQRLIDSKWTGEQTVAAVKLVNAVKPPRGYEALFAIDRLQEMAAGQEPTEVTHLAVRARTARTFELTHSAYRYTLWM